MTFEFINTEKDTKASNKKEEVPSPVDNRFTFINMVLK